MTRTDLRLALRLHRFEIVGFGLLIGLLALAAVVIAANLDATGYGAHCSQVEANPPECEAMGRAFYGLQQSQVSPVQAVLLVLPYLLGAMVGGPLVARELERGTSRLAWSLAPSRFRWFVARLLPALVVVFGLAFVAGAALDRLTAAVEPWTDVANGFTNFGFRGVVLAARATFVFAIGVSAGAMLGRVLPTLLVTAVVAYVGLAGGSYVHGRILATEAVVADGEIGNPGDLYVDQRFRLPDGRLVDWREMEALYPYPEDGTSWAGEGLPIVAFVVPGERYRQVELREVGALGGGSVVALGLAALAVRRRRPG
jgi:hypothetical protein